VTETYFSQHNVSATKKTNITAWADNFVPTNKKCRTGIFVETYLVLFLIVRVLVCIEPCKDQLGDGKDRLQRQKT
jgi:hypothetical protein